MLELVIFCHSLKMPTLQGPFLITTSAGRSLVAARYEIATQRLLVVSCVNLIKSYDETCILLRVLFN